MGELARKVLPPPGLPRQLVVQAALVAVGWGVYLTGSVVFFTLYVGLSAVQVGVGLSIAAFVGLVAALPLGHLADRVGGRTAWVVGAAGGACCFAAYPLARGFWSYVLILAVQTLAVALVDAGRNVYTAAAVPREIRVRTMGFARAYLNVGFTAGAGIGSAAIGLNSRTGLLVLVLANAAGQAVSAVVVSRWPHVHAVSEGPRPAPWRVLRDRPFMAMTGIFSIMALNEIIFMTIVPLWAITHTDAPKPVLGALFALNTIMAVLLQVPATRDADSAAGAQRLLTRAALATGLACPIFALAGRTGGWVTVAVLAAGVVVLTGTELWGSAAQWWVTTEVPPPDQRGVYLGAATATMGVAKVIGPAALTFLAVHTGGWGWWVIGLGFAASALLVRPVFAWVGRTPRAVAARPDPDLHPP